MSVITKQVPERKTFRLNEHDPEMKTWDELGLGIQRRLSDEDRRLSQTLRNIDARIEILELPDGVSVKANSRVGHVAFDAFDLVVLPKFEHLVHEEGTWSPLAALLAYAFDLTDWKKKFVGLRRSPETFFADLLVYWLLEETKSIQRRGLFQRYGKERNNLSMMRGKVDFTTWFRQGALPSERMPCVFHARSFDNILNQTLCAGLRRAATLTRSLTLKNECCLLADSFAMSVTERSLERHLLCDALRALNRLNAYYENAVRIVQMLHLGSGGFIHGPSGESQTQIPGFFFDMNKLFESVLTKFLRDNLPHEKYEVLPQKNSHMATAPAEKKRLYGIPDIIVEIRGTVPVQRIVLDAKYFTISPGRGPIEQLAMYALTCSEHNGRYRSTILFPDTPGTRTPPWDVFVHRYDKTHEDAICTITVRPVDMLRLIELIDRGQRGDKTNFAITLIGEQSS